MRAAWPQRPAVPAAAVIAAGDASDTLSLHKALANWEYLAQEMGRNPDLQVNAAHPEFATDVLKIFRVSSSDAGSDEDREDDADACALESMWRKASLLG